MNRNFRCVPIIIALALVVAALPGCAKNAAPSRTYLDMLTLLPDTPGMRHQVYITDFAKVRDLYSIPVPGPDADSETLMSYVASLLSPSTLVSFDSFLSGIGRYSANNPIRRQNVGFGAQDIDLAVLAGTPPTTFEIVKGNLDAARTDSAISVSNTQIARERYAKQVYQGVTIHSWGDGFKVDLSNVLSPPVFDQLGRAEPIAVWGNYGVRTPGLDGIKAVIDLSKGRKPDIGGVTVPSLASAREFRSLAENLGKFGAYSIFLSDNAQTIANSLNAEPSWKNTPLLRPYQTLGIGAGKDEVGQYTALVLVHTGEELARQNVDLLRQRINETSSTRYNTGWKNLITTADIWSEGPVLLAKLRKGSNASPGFGWFFQQDPLILSGS